MIDKRIKIYPVVKDSTTLSPPRYSSVSMPCLQCHSRHNTVLSLTTGSDYYDFRESYRQSSP